MKNSILNYSTEELDDFIVTDYFSKDIFINDIFSTLEEYLELYEMDDDDKLERISYEFYGDTNYWDLLLLINNLNPLFQMAYNFDILTDEVTTKIDLYSNVIYSHPPLTPERKTAGYNYLLDKLTTQNEQNRSIYVVKPNYLNDVLGILKTNGYL